MRIKEVGYDRLYSFGKYENERFHFLAEVNEGESADKVLAELFLKVCSIEDCLQAYRDLLGVIEWYRRRVADKNKEIAQISSEIADLKVKIDEITQAIREGRADYDMRLRHACDRDSYKRLKEGLAESQKELMKYEAKLKKAVELKNTLLNRIKEGNFSLEGLEIERIPSEYYY